MSFLRPEAVAVLTRWREVGAAAASLGLGLWFVALGGFFFVPLGGLVLILASGWVVIALRRLRFQRSVAAPGVVEVDEGQVGYLGPNFGGYLALRELAELRMIRLQGQRHWRLRQSDGQILIIPTTAAGADQLFDAFATLPGADMSLIAAALDGHAETQLLWTSRPQVALT